MRLLCTLAGLALVWPASLAAAEVPPGAAKTYEVPYRLTPVQHLLVRAKINGKGPYNFIVDTGAPALFVAVPVGHKLGIRADRAGWGTLDRFEVEGGVVLEKMKARIETPFQLEGMNGLNLEGVELHGIIGYTVLARFRIEVDLTRDKMRWTRLRFDPPAPMRMGGRGGAPGGLDAVGGIMKFLGTFLGKNVAPAPVLRGFVGMELADADEGAEVKSVLAGGPAAAAGLRAGDRITAIGGKAVSSRRDFERLTASAPAGRTLRLNVLRAGSTTELRLRPAEGL